VCSLNSRSMNGRFPPCLHVQRRQTIAWNARIPVEICIPLNHKYSSLIPVLKKSDGTTVQELMWCFQRLFLNIRMHIQVIANDLTERHFSNFSQLLRCEPNSWITSFIPETVTFSQIPELRSNYACHDWSQQATLYWAFNK